MQQVSYCLIMPNPQIFGWIIFPDGQFFQPIAYTRNHVIRYMPKLSNRINGNTNNKSRIMQDRILSTVGMKREDDAKYIVSYGGGINSTAMIVYLVKNKFPLCIFRYRR